MDWADRRRFFILLLLGGIAVAFLASLSFAAFYQAPSCADEKMNQGENGVDCGGPCSLLCRADVQPPTVLFTQALSEGARTDVVASVENKNARAAAKGVPYSISVYGPDQALIGSYAGTIDLPPASRVPVFVPGAVAGSRPGARAFLTIDPAAPVWYRVDAAPQAPSVSSVSLGGTASAPRVKAVLSNPATAPLLNVRAVVFVRGTGGNVIAASSTVIPSLPGQGTVQASFTWNEPFSEVPLSVEVIPVLALP